MKLGIESWAQENLDENAIEIMKESVMCYKIGAYRSAFLMSYLAFKLTIRYRIIKSPSYPENYNNKIEWDRNVLNKLRNDDEWEDFVNEIVKASSNENELKDIFIFSNRERYINRYMYWKDIRNSCAHAKNEHINSATVEQFWNYMQDDLSDFYVLGGKKYLLNELIERYKYYNSDKGKNIIRLLQDIKIVYRDELESFFINFLDELLKENRDLVDDNNLEFWKSMINCKYEEIQKAFVYSISEKKDLFLNFYEYFPAILELIFSIDSRFIQDYTNSLLCKGFWYSDKYKKCFWSILTSSLQLQPQSIAIDYITSKYKNFELIENIELEEYEVEILNYYSIFKSFIFNAGSDLFRNDGQNHWDYYSYGSRKRDEYIIKCFMYITWDQELIKKMNGALEYLKENVDSRTNLDSIHNGKRRISVYKEILLQNKERIIKFWEDNHIDENEYNHISEVLNINNQK